MAKKSKTITCSIKGLGINATKKIVLSDKEAFIKLTTSQANRLVKRQCNDLAELYIDAVKIAHLIDNYDPSEKIPN